MWTFLPREEEPLKEKRHIFRRSSGGGGDLNPLYEVIDRYEDEVIAIIAVGIGPIISVLTTWKGISEKGRSFKLGVCTSIAFT